MLAVPAFQLRHPVAYLIASVANYGSLHNCPPSVAENGTGTSWMS